MISFNINMKIDFLTVLFFLISIILVYLVRKADNDLLKKLRKLSRLKRTG